LSEFGFRGLANCLTKTRQEREHHSGQHQRGNLDIQ
jgi:hypothetical protein